MIILAALALAQSLYYPVTPCRIYDSVNRPDPEIKTAVVATVKVTEKCGVPADAEAVTMNVTVWPNTVMGYLTLWPSREPMPIASTVNALQGGLLANLEIVKLGHGSVDIFANGDTHLILDVKGYFAKPAPVAQEVGTITYLGVPMVVRLDSVVVKLDGKEVPQDKIKVAGNGIQVVGVERGWYTVELKYEGRKDQKP